MFSTGHLTSGLVVASLLQLEGPAFLALVAASVLTDWDYSLALLTKKNHRYFLTHCPPLVALALVPLALWVHPLFWPILGGMMLHFALDLWDFGLRLNPFRRRVYGARLLDVAEDADFATYLRTYFRDRRFLLAEIALAALAAGLLLLRVL